MRLPEKFEDRMKKMLKDEYDDFIKSMDETPIFTGIRINTSKVGAKDAVIKEFGELQNVSWCSEGFYAEKEPLRLRMGMRRWPDKSTWNSRSPLRRIFSLLMCSLVMPDVMKGMRMLLGISTTSSLPVYWYTTRMIKCNMTVMTMVFSIRR